jgi:hypothetical protein
MAYEALKAEMKMWRMGAGPLPPKYIALHKAAAEASLPALSAKFGFRVIATEMKSDGWCDGMKVLRVIAEDQVCKLHDLHWSDANGGSWFENGALFFRPAKAPGYM